MNIIITIIIIIIIMRDNDHHHDHHHHLALSQHPRRWHGGTKLSHAWRSETLNPKSAQKWEKLLRSKMSLKL